MGTLESDAVVEQSLNPTQSDTNVIKIGIFNADSDVNIANRLVDKLKQHPKCEVERFDFLKAGASYMDLIVEFIESKDTILWIATSISLQDTAMMETTSRLAQYASQLVSPAEVHFAVVQPREALSVKLPKKFRAYTALVEDSSFSERVSKTLEYSRKLKLKRIKHAAKSRQSTATTSAVGGSGLTLLNPVSDDVRQTSETMSDTVSEPQGSIPLRAKPECRPEPEDPAESNVTVNPGGNNTYIINAEHVNINVKGS